MIFKNLIFTKKEQKKIKNLSQNSEKKSKMFENDINFLKQYCHLSEYEYVCMYVACTII